MVVFFNTKRQCLMPQRSIYLHYSVGGNKRQHDVISRTIGSRQQCPSPETHKLPISFGEKTEKMYQGGVDCEIDV